MEKDEEDIKIDDDAPKLEDTKTSTDFYDDMPESVADFLKETHPLNKKTSSKSEVDSPKAYGTNSYARPKTATHERAMSVKDIFSNSQFISRMIGILAVIFFVLVVFFLVLKNNSLAKELADAKPYVEQNASMQVKINDLGLENGELKAQVSSLYEQGGVPNQTINNGEESSSISGNNNAGSTTQGTTVAVSDLPQKYIVVKGDSLSKISVKFYGNSSHVKDITDANNLKNPNALQLGMELTIPALQ